MHPSLEFDHIGVAVSDIAEGRELVAAMLQVNRWTEVFKDPGIGVYVQFGIGATGPCFELIAPLDESSPISGALKSGRGILNHVAYLVKDLRQSSEALRDLGCFPVSEPQPAVAYGGRNVHFLQSPLRFLIELIEAPDHRHSFGPELFDYAPVE